MTTYATVGDIFRQAQLGLAEASWVPVLVYCSPRPDGCLVGEVRQTVVGAVWDPKDSGLSDRKRRLAQRMQARTDIDLDVPIEDVDKRTWNLLTHGLPPRPVPLDAFKDDDAARCECRDHGESYVSIAELRATFTEATTPPTKVIKIAAHTR